MRIICGADHGGYELMQSVTKHLRAKGIETEYIGPDSPKAYCDYPDVVVEAASQFRTSNADFLFLACGTGIGISIAANKIDGISCALVYNESTARLAREHNGANSLAFGGREMDNAAVLRAIDIFLSTSESNAERHVRRRGKIAEL